MGVMKRAILLTLPLLLLVAACTKNTASPSPIPPPDSPVSTTIPPGGVPTEPSPSPVEPKTGLENVRPVQWQDATAGTDDRSVTLTWFTGPPECYGLDHVDVAYNAHDITITLFEGTVPGAQVCTEIAMFVSTTVALDQDIAGRKIVDGAKKGGQAPTGG
jgi:hypothetical protein